MKPLQNFSYFMHYIATLLLLILALPVHAQETNLSGTITDKKSGEALIGVRVAVFADTTVSAKPLRQARSNKYGFYSLAALPKGLYFLVTEAFGYARMVRSVSVPLEQERLNLALTPKDIRLADVSVESKRPLSPTAISTIEISPERLKQLPALGETDILRALQLMPGVKAGSEISSGLFVRGGSPDQNLTLLDGVPLYNPGHLLGIFSAFNADAISDIRLYKGVFPAEFGGRLSSVLDVTMREGNREHFQGKADLSFLSARLSLEGPIGNKASFLLSGRRMYYDLFARLLGGERAAVYGFYDLTAKINFTLSDRDKIFVSGYFGQDESIPSTLPSLDNVLSWGNATAHLRWTHIFSSTLFSTVSASYTNYQFFFGDRIKSSDVPKSQNIFQSRSRIDDLNAKAELQWTPAQEHQVKIGAEATQHRFLNFLYGGPFGTLPTQSPASEGEYASALAMALYAQDEWSITPELILNAGARATYFSSGQHLRVEPRLSAVYKFTPDVSFKAAYGITHQFVQMVAQGGVSVPTETWFPASASVQPSRSSQINAGAEVYLFDRELLITGEAYYKTVENLYEFREDAEFRSGAPLVTQITHGNGTAYGMEIFLNKQIGQWTGWIGYTLSWTDRQFAELNNGKPFFARFDRRHELQVTGSYKVSDAWELGAVFVFGSGQPLTMPVGFANFMLISPQNQSGTTTNHLPKQDDILPYNIWTSYQGHFIYSERNAVCMAPYHRLDVSATHRFSWLGRPFTLGLNIYNVYARNNPYLYYIQYYSPPPTRPGPPTEASRVRVLQYSFFTIIPSVSISFTF